MSTNDDITKQHDVVVPEPDEPDSSGSGSLSGHAPDPEADDSVDTAYEKAFGNEPEGKTIAEEIDQDEKDIAEE